MNIKSKSNIFYICMLLHAMTLPINAAPFTTNITGTIDWILINNGPDAYGIGASIMSLGDTYDFSMTHDSDSAMFYTGSDGTGVDYDFSGSPYGGSLSINGNNFSSLTSALNVGNDVVLPPPPDFAVIQPLVDAGVPSDLSGLVIDTYWMGVTSDDFSWDSNGNEFQGLELSVVFLDLSGTIFNNTLIPGSVPSLDTIDFAFFQIEQWENGDFVFQAGGMLANNYVPIPAAIWLFGSGLIGLIGLARRKA